MNSIPCSVWLSRKELNQRSKIFLLSVQNDLFILGAELAFPKNEKSSIPGIDAGRIELLEKEIDLLSANLPVLHNFILPGGTKSAALLHLSRTFCRRAERLAVSLSRQTEIDPLILMYLNRLSDVLFTTARYQNHLEHQPETIWTNPQKKP